MSVFGKIFDRIFHRAEAAQAPAQSPGSPAPGQSPGTLATAPAAPAPAAANQAAVAAPQQPQPVDVESMLNGLAARNPQKLNWRSSIVDLMKLLDLDSSLQERKELATELGYTGAKDGSAEMNLWLHRQVMNKLAANGGKVPADLKD
jgi:3-oxoacyl-ACP reductase-like protein